MADRLEVRELASPHDALARSDGSVRVRRGTADRPEAALTTDADTLHAVALGKRPIADTVESGDLRLDGDPQAISGLTGLLQALTSAPADQTA